MANLQQTLDALQPYVIGIRYLDGHPVVDTVFKEGWTVPDSDIIKKVKGNNELNYYMVFSEKDGIGLDELLEYVNVTIKANIEREKKHDLLKEKVNELKELFKKTSLTKLRRLKFAFDDEELLSDLNDFNLDEPSELEEKISKSEVLIPDVSSIEKNIESEYQEDISEEDAEILEEEARAENFRRMQDAKKINGHTQKISQRVELPPKKAFQETDVDVLEPYCDCGPEEACSKCIGNKDL